MSTAFRGNFPYQLDKTLNKMFMEAGKSYEPDYPKFGFKVMDAPAGDYYSAAEISGLAGLSIMGEGDRITFQIPKEGNKKTVYYSKYGTGFQVTEELLEDQLFSKIEKVPATMVVQALDLVDQACADILNGGFATEKSWDGAYLFANSHTRLNYSTALDNLGATDLSETALQDVFEHFKKMRDESGLLRPMKLKKLIVPVEEMWMAYRLAKQAGGITAATADLPNMSGNLMTTNPKNGMVDSWEVVVSPRITDTDSWFCLAENPELYLLWKRRAKLQKGGDYQTGNILYKTTIRFAAFSLGYKEVWGSPGA